MLGDTMTANNLVQINSKPTRHWLGKHSTPDLFKTNMHGKMSEVHHFPNLTSEHEAIWVKNSSDDIIFQPQF